MGSGPQFEQSRRYETAQRAARQSEGETVKAKEGQSLTHR